MNGKIRRRLEMGRRALLFSQAHPDPDPGYGKKVARLENLMEEARELEGRQLKGLLQVHAAAEHKRGLRRTMKLGHLTYLIRLGAAASREEPALREVFDWGHASRAQLEFRASAGRIAAQALNYREVLEPYGLSAAVLESLEGMLNEFDRAAEELLEGQLMHVAATAGLKQVSDEILKTVRILDGYYRIRLAQDVNALAAWASASKVTAHSPRAEGDSEPNAPGPEGGMRPAA